MAHKDTSLGVGASTLGSLRCGAHSHPGLTADSTAWVDTCFIHSGRCAALPAENRLPATVRRRRDPALLPLRGKGVPTVTRFMRHGQFALLSLALACGAGTEPNRGGGGAIGPIGPFPTGLTGKVAFVTYTHVTSPPQPHSEQEVHVIGIADPADRAIYTTQDVDVEGLTWAPDGEHLVIQTFKLKVGPNGENQSTWQLHLLNMAGNDQVFFYGTWPQVAYHPAYGADGRLAYFGYNCITILGGSTYPNLWDANSYLSWAPDGSALVYTQEFAYAQQFTGLMKLTLADLSLTQLVAPDGGEVITQPAVSPDGARIAIMRFGGGRHHQEIWTVTAAGADAQQVTTGFEDYSPSWTPGGQHIVFARTYGSAPGIYLIAPSGGTPTRVVGVSEPTFVTSVAWSR